MNPLVTPSWLAGRLGDSSTVVLDATLPPVGVVPAVETRGRYAAKHIPGAVFFNIAPDHDNVWVRSYRCGGGRSRLRDRRGKAGSVIRRIMGGVCSTS